MDFKRNKYLLKITHHTHNSKLARTNPSDWGKITLPQNKEKGQALPNEDNHTKEIKSESTSIYSIKVNLYNTMTNLMEERRKEHVAHSKVVELDAKLKIDINKLQIKYLSLEDKLKMIENQLALDKKCIKEVRRDSYRLT